MGYLYIFFTILFTVYGQLIIKWRVDLIGAMPIDFSGKLTYFFHVFMDLWVISGFLAAFLASVSWIATLNKFELSFAYPFMSFTFPIVLLLSVFLFNEQLIWQKIVGLIFIIIGIIVLTQK